jgi:hypothetical protein
VEEHPSKEGKMAHKYVVGSTVAAGILFAVALVLLKNGDKSVEADSRSPGPRRPPRALVLTDLGECQADLERMKASGWSVKPIRALELEALDQKHPYQGGPSDYDVAWVPAKENYPALRRIMRDGGPLDRFAKKGGVVAVMDLTPAKFMLDIAPGGTDAEPLPAGGAGPVAIKAVDHPMITGYYIGGMPLVPQSLDPQQKGGRCCIVNTPQGSQAVVVAANSLGPVIVDYTRGGGRVFICALLEEREACRCNAMLYIQSLIK